MFLFREFLKKKSSFKLYTSFVQIVFKEPPFNVFIPNSYEIRDSHTNLTGDDWRIPILTVLRPETKKLNFQSQKLCKRLAKSSF